MRILRKWYARLFPKVYIRKGIARVEKEFLEKRRHASQLTLEERQKLESNFASELEYWHGCRYSIEDQELIRAARKMDIFLEDIPIPSPQILLSDEGYYRINNYGESILREEVRDELIKKMRARQSSYNKEQREKVEYYVKITTSITAACTGLIGVVIGLLTIMRW